MPKRRLKLKYIDIHVDPGAHVLADEHAGRQRSSAFPGETKLRQTPKRRVAALTRSLHGAVSSDGVASKTLPTSHG
jgi:hypothetical protein